MKLKILSWNIWIYGDFKKVSEFIKQTEPDIIGLQEVKDDDPDFDIVAYLSGLGYEYIFTPVKHIWGGKTYVNGPAIFSKHPIIKKETHALSKTDPRVAVQADIKVGGEVLHVFNTHLMHTHQQPSEAQDLQVEDLIKVLTTKNTILMGDFNATPESNAIKKIKEILVDTDMNSLPTWSLDIKGCSVCQHETVDIKLDYIFLSQDMKHDPFEVLQSGGSNHLPVSAIINL